jgi:signal transduction histidine kinase
MAQHAIDAIGEKTSSRSMPRSLPTLGMRGGLGKTLLISFLLLAIVPLSLLAFLTYHEIQRDTRQKSVASLEAVVALKEAHLIDWIRGYERELSLLADALDRHADPMAEITAALALDPTLTGLILVDRDTGRVLASTNHAWYATEAVEPLLTDEKGLVIASPTSADLQPLLAISYPWDGRQLIALPGWDALQRIVAASGASWEGSATHLVMSNGWMLSEEGLAQVPAGAQGSLSQGINEIWQERDGSGAYDGLAGEPVFGAYRWNPALQVGILAEQSQRQALEMGNTLTALVVGATLVVALVTAAIAAAVTRRVTRPIVQLTETAAWMARGKLNQRVVISRNDEIGILARAFNRMAAELRILYENLEAKVAERTMQLEAANEQTSYHLIQLATSAEVARVATSIRQLDSLLATVVQLIGRAFELDHTYIYLLDENGEWAEPATLPAEHSHDHGLPAEKVKVGGPSLVGQVAADGQRRVVRGDDLANPGAHRGAAPVLKPTVVSEMGVPLQVQDRTLGVLELHSSRLDDFDENEQVLYQSLADQISIAIENARAYALERETVERLRELDRLQSQFLTNMSHALRTPLTSIIGFSRVLLKELDGPLTETQSADLTAIYESGRQLLGLINDMLELSRLELGVAPFSPGAVDLREIIEGVMATTRALARGKAVQIYENVPADLPILYTDGQRVRQVVLALLSNAVKYTDEGSIYLEARIDDGHVTISVRDTALAIPSDELERIFSDPGAPSAGSRAGDSGADDVPSFGLAISKRVVERLGGQIWVESVEGTGSVFTFTLPIEPIDDLRSDRGNQDAHLD